MKRFKIILTLFFSLTFLNCKDKAFDSDKYLNFLAAVENSSTFSYFTVIKAKDLHTGLTKEICTKGNFVSGALHIELHANYDDNGERKVLNFAKATKDRCFKFKNKKALDNISFFNYDPSQLAKIEKKYDFNKIGEIITRDKKFSIQLPDEEMKLFAHVLFNMGYMTGENNCFGGTLVYVDRNKNANDQASAQHGYLQ